MGNHFGENLSFCTSQSAGSVGCFQEIATNCLSVNTLTQLAKKDIYMRLCSDWMWRLTRCSDTNQSQWICSRPSEPPAAVSVYIIRDKNIIIRHKVA